MKKVTHDTLIKAACKWLFKNYPIVITEMSCTREEPDAIGFGWGYSTIVECKISRSDFLADRRKRALRLFVGMGSARYYLVPQDINVDINDIPDKYGLLVYKDGRSHPQLIKKAEPITDKRNTVSEISLLCSAIRRMGSVSYCPTCRKGVRAEGTSVRFYQYDSKNRATLGVKK